MADSIQMMESLFQKKNCADVVISSVFETYLFNQTFEMDGKELVQESIDICLERETYYANDIRKENLAFLEKAYSSIESAEGSQFCNFAFGPEREKSNPGERITYDIPVTECE